MKLTTALIAAAVALYAFGARHRSAPSSTAGSASGSKTAGSSTPSGPASIDPGMVILRNDHIDDGIAIRSPFGGDPGIVVPPPHEIGTKEASS